MMDALNNREWAVLAWLLVALVAMLFSKTIRPSMLNVVKSFLNPRIVGPLVLMAGYIWAEVWLGSKLSLWQSDLTKDTIVWALTAGLVLFFKLDEATKQPRFFRRRVLAAFGITVFLEVFLNIFVLSLPAELFLQPFLVFITALGAVAATNPKHKLVKKLMDGLLGIIGIGLLLFAVTELITSWQAIDKGNLLLQLALPVWLSIGLLPFMYVFALYANYETTFRRIGLFCETWRSRLRARVAILVVLNIQTYKVGAFVGVWLSKIAEASNLIEALKIVNTFRKSALAQKTKQASAANAL